MKRGNHQTRSPRNPARLITTRAHAPPSPVAAAQQLTRAPRTDKERGTAPKQALSAGRPLLRVEEGTKAMIVLGADTHKSSHTVAAVDTATGQVLGDKTIAVGKRGFAALVLWAR